MTRIAWIGLLVAGCASSGPELEFALRVTMPSIEVPSPGAPDDEGARPEPPPDPPPSEAEVLERAIRDYDADSLERFVEARAERLETDRTASLAEVRRFARAALHLAEIRKFEATVAAGAQERRTAVERRLAVARRGSAVAAAGLEKAPDDPDLLFARGELLAYLIDGAVSGMRYGSKAREACERAVALGAGPEAELALARRFYYLPPISGGDLDRAARDVESILGRHPDFEPGWAFLGEVRQAQGRRDDAAAAFEKAVELNPESLRGTFFLAHPEVVPRP